MVTTGTSAAKIAVNGQISFLLLKVKRCRQILVHTCREDAGSLAVSPLTRVLWVTDGQAAFLCCGCGGGRAELSLPAVSDHSGCVSAAEREGAVAESHLSYSASQL